jgi:hypothetical protein
VGDASPSVPLHQVCHVLSIAPSLYSVLLSLCDSRQSQHFRSGPLIMSVIMSAKGPRTGGVQVQHQGKYIRFFFVFYVLKK